MVFCDLCELAAATLQFLSIYLSFGEQNETKTENTIEQTPTHTLRDNEVNTPFQTQTLGGTM